VSSLLGPDGNGPITVGLSRAFQLSADYDPQNFQAALIKLQPMLPAAVDPPGQPLGALGDN
jgi:hypothetical protein